MPIDASIPLSVKQFQAPDVMGQAAQAFQLKGLQTQNQASQEALADTLQKRRERMEVKDVLGKADLTTPEGQKLAIAEVGKINPELGMKFQDQLQKSQLTQSTIDKNSMETASKKNDILGQAAAGVFMQYQEFKKQGMSEEQARAAVTPAYKESIAGLVQQGLMPPEAANSEFDPVKTGQFLYHSIKAKDYFAQQEKERHNQELEGQGQQKVDIQGQRLGMEGQRLGMEGQRLGMEAAKTGAYVNNMNSQVQNRNAATSSGVRQLTQGETKERGLPAGNYQVKVGGKNDGEVKAIQAPRNQLVTPSQLNDARTNIRNVSSIKAQLKNVKNAWKNVKGTISAGGGGQGHLPTPSGQEFDRSVALLSPLLRKIIRTTGEGSTSDYESKLTQAALPDRTNYESTVEQQIKDIEDLVSGMEQGYNNILMDAGVNDSGRKPPSSMQFNDADLEHTAQKYGITKEEVLRRMGKK